MASANYMLPFPLIWSGFEMESGTSFLNGQSL
jgi:hypothetical protein